MAINKNDLYPEIAHALARTQVLALGFDGAIIGATFARLNVIEALQRTNKSFDANLFTEDINRIIVELK